MKFKHLICMLILAIGMIAIQPKLQAKAPPGSTLLLIQANPNEGATISTQSTDQTTNQTGVTCESPRTIYGVNISIIIPAILGVMEIVFRLVPTSTSYTPLTLAYNIISAFVPNRGPNGTEHLINPAQKPPGTDIPGLG